MVLQGIAKKADSGLIGFDTAIPLTAKSARDYWDKGYRFCVRYVSRTDASRQRNSERGLADLSEAEGNLILQQGMALMVVQHVAATGWVPTLQLGTEYGKNAARYAAAAGMPGDVTVWLDLEDIPAGTPKADIKAYANAWFGQVREAGFSPGVYVGFNVWLNSDELFFDLATKHYWRAAGNIPEVSHRGYQMIQHVIKDGPHGELDKNLVKADLMGELPMWLAPTNG